MKKIFFIFLTLGFFTDLCAGQFKIFAGLLGPQSLTNIRLDLEVDPLSPLTTVYIDPISPADYSELDQSVTISFPDGYKKIYCSFNVETEYDVNFVSTIVYPSLNYKLGYGGNNFFLTLFTELS